MHLNKWYPRKKHCFVTKVNDGGFIFPDTWIGINKKVSVKLKVLKHSQIGTSIGATPKDNALIEDRFDEEAKNANANGEYDDDHARVNTSNMKKMIKMRKKKGKTQIGVDEKINSK